MSRSDDLHGDLRTIALTDGAAAWSNAGFDVRDGVVSLGEVTIRLEAGTIGLALHGVDTDLDGVAHVGAVPSSDVQAHPNGVSGLDHVVLSSGDLERTRTTLGRAGLELRRTRRIELPDGAREQSFYWLGRTLLELVGPVDQRDDEPARLWGLALVTPDLDATAAYLGENCSDVRDAVQPGRRIATLRTTQLAIELPIAIMSPHPRRSTH